MLEKELSLPSEDIYPVDPWKIIQTQYSPELCAQDETIFTTANGYLGIRGNFEENHPVFQRGTFINGFYETWPIRYPEEAFGFAKTGQTILNVTDAHILRLYVNQELLNLNTAHFNKFERVLDMKAATLNREIIWETPQGLKVLIKSERLVSFKRRHLAAIKYEVTVLDEDAYVDISSEMMCEQEENTEEDDPRKAPSFTHEVFQAQKRIEKGERVILAHKTQNSGMTIACGMDHQMNTENTYDVNLSDDDFHCKLVYSIEAKANKPITLIKYLNFFTSATETADELCERSHQSFEEVINKGYEYIVNGQKEFMDEFWQRSDIAIETDNPRAQQCLRFNLFHICQATARAEGAGVGARGVTGSAYEGHYFWDTEIYVLPFLIYTEPRIARNLLQFRHSILDQARDIARSVNQKGALFPWRTINGEEASAFFAAGTAQYHINADIMYALKKYVDVTGDEAFLFEYGAEMLIETARLWVDLGFFNKDDGKFHIHGVTGPDEYTALVDNNLYTNMMARENLRYAAQTIESINEKQPEVLKTLLNKTALNLKEVDDWKRAADQMYIPYDKDQEIFPQDDQFLKREVWDFENTPSEKYPLLLHYHPLVLYRSQVLKQADVVMAMFLLGHEFTSEEKQRNFDYYESLTTGDSSLSACSQGIIALELGQRELAAGYLRRTAYMDFADICGNSQDGAHIAAMGGTWLGLVYGVAGMRDYGGKISFNPKLFERIKRMSFSLTIRGQVLKITLTSKEATYTLTQGQNLTIQHQGQDIQLKENDPVKVTIQASI